MKFLSQQKLSNLLILVTEIEMFSYWWNFSHWLHWKLTTSGAAGDKNFINMTTFPFVLCNRNPDNVPVYTGWMLPSSVGYIVFTTNMVASYFLLTNWVSHRFPNHPEVATIDKSALWHEDMTYVKALSDPRGKYMVCWFFVWLNYLWDHRWKLFVNYV